MSVICQECGTEIPDSEKFCPVCAWRVPNSLRKVSATAELTEETQTEETQTCANCGAVLPKGAKFCNECGAKAGPLAEARTEETEAETSSSTAVIEDEEPASDSGSSSSAVGLSSEEKEQALESVLVDIGDIKRRIQEIKEEKLNNEDSDVRVEIRTSEILLENYIINVEKAVLRFSDDKQFVKTLEKKKKELKSLQTGLVKLGEQQNVRNRESDLKGKVKETKYKIEHMKDTARNVSDLIGVFAPFVIVIVCIIFIVIASIMEDSFIDGITDNYFGKIGLVTILGFVQYKLVKTYQPEGVIRVGALILVLVCWFLFIEDVLLLLDNLMMLL